MNLPDLRFDAGGVLAMASPATNSMFFYYTRRYPWLDGATIFFGHVSIKE
jgi:cyclophilin family peptidyl-prolyl cis-trans isomerase